MILKKENMSIQPKRLEDPSLPTQAIAQNLMIAMVENRVTQQAAIDKINQAADQVVLALQKHLQKFTEQNADVQLKLQASLQQEQELDDIDKKLVQKHRLAWVDVGRRRNYWSQSYQRDLNRLDDHSNSALCTLDMFEKMALLPSKSVETRWKQNHPDFFKVKKKFN